MTTYFTLVSVRNKVAVGLFFAFLSISIIADAKTYTCSCAYQDGGSTVSFDYVAVGSGCCTGATNTGSAFYSRTTGNTTTEAGYIEPSFAQSMCCGY
ncbi:hypothetical protein [Fibrivirga algicola]|uniref:Secreted protein n=1 Tax=Fibrivirga algicola TaxID=2950420 RepID=A0ABX0QDA6_9BACT|nr:hypothetical protein [Fibrivirga algicola]NID09972.1 hypothetical protein [Fibrivirga algicola]